MTVRAQAPRRTTRTFSKSAHAPLWAQVRHDLRRRLAAGEFDGGFPSDRALVNEYGVSRHTVREALRELQDDGVLTRQRGRGTFVTALAIEQPVGPLYSLFKSIEEQGYRQESDVLALEKSVDASIAIRLHLNPTAKLFHLRRVRRADGIAFALDDIWMPASLVAPLFAVDFQHTAVYGELERLVGLRPVSGWERIHPGIPDTECRRLLGIDANQAIFVVERYTEHDAGPLEWRETVIRGDAYTFLTNWTNSQSTSQFTTSKRNYTA
jgi:GntR family transcriptional regulator